MAAVAAATMFVTPRPRALSANEAARLAARSAVRSSMRPVSASPFPSRQASPALATVTTRIGLLPKPTSESVAKGITRVIIVCTVVVALTELMFAGLLALGGGR